MATHGRPGGQQPRDHALLAFAEMRLAVILEYLRYGEIGRLLDLRIGVEEGQVQQIGEPPADARLAGAHHADEHDAALAEPLANALGLLVVGNGVACGQRVNPPRGEVLCRSLICQAFLLPLLSVSRTG